LFASNVHKDSDYDNYIVFKNEFENPLSDEHNIYRNLSKQEGRHSPADILVENKNKFY